MKLILFFFKVSSQYRLTWNFWSAMVFRSFSQTVLKNHFFPVSLYVFDFPTVVSCLCLILYIFYISPLRWDFLNSNIVRKLPISLCSSIPPFKLLMKVMIRLSYLAMQTATWPLSDHYFDRFLLCCLKSNLPSWKIVINNTGILLVSYLQIPE